MSLDGCGQALILNISRRTLPQLYTLYTRTINRLPLHRNIESERRGQVEEFGCAVCVCVRV